MNETKNELIKKYNLNESHGVWQPEIDNWMSVEVSRFVLGRLPNENDKVKDIAIKFLDISKKNPAKMMKNERWGSLFLTAKRMLYKELNKQNETRR